MDPSHFDSLARALAGGSTRRRLMAALAAMPLVGGLAGLTLDEAEAEKPRNRLQRRKQQRRRKQRNRKRRRNREKSKGAAGGGGKGGQKKGGNRPSACTPNSGACTTGSDCCSGNCFNFVCAAPVTSCGGATCS
ncbi:MAG: hypothetical protein KC442_01005, partial [Thermomicrobiales bacterium]|nr:hypothetical protein [Thermomicrobiales bacterium]